LSLSFRFFSGKGQRKATKATEGQKLEPEFDLLLFFIERDELDIYDIPIYKITTDFLEYIHQMEKLNIELASDFILTASTLMHIKARMLLPRPERNEEGEIVDPRTELVERLLEYKRYKMVLDQIQNLELDRQGFSQPARPPLETQIAQCEIARPCGRFGDGGSFFRSAAGKS
jgi:chromatin segregation and condensation protein Rec8/ScpA/Scc1 (kleisin family)